MSIVTKISITQTEQEYLLAIPPWQKERAKEIEGRRWDSDRKVWVYPRTKRTHRALMTEFGDDLQKVEITAPDWDVESKKPADLERQNAMLIKQFEENNKKIERLLNAKSDEEKISTFQSTIAEQKIKINDLETELGVKQNKLKQAENDYAYLLKKSIQQPNSNANNSLEDGIKALVISSAGNNQTLESILNEFGISERFVTEVRKKLTNYLREKLKDEHSTLFELLGQAQETDPELMPREAIDLAHTIRKQRNILQYNDDDDLTRRIRIIYTVIACSLLWPHLNMEPHRPPNED